MQRVLRDVSRARRKPSKSIRANNLPCCKPLAHEYMPSVVERLQPYSGERPIFDLYHIDDDIARALGRRVDLKSGGYLVIDQTEALTTIDVNTGGFVGARNFDDTVFAPTQKLHKPLPANCACAIGWHHHRRFHRHGARRPPRGRAGRIPQTSHP